MILPDVNVLVYAHREDAEDHAEYRLGLEKIIQGGQPYGMSDPVLSGFHRVVTHSRIFTTPSPVSSAFDFARQVREQPNCQIIAPGPRHWHIFSDLCQSIPARGTRPGSDWFAALALEAGCEWITTDRDYEKFPGLRRRHPLTGKSSGQNQTRGRG